MTHSLVHVLWEKPWVHRNPIRLSLLSTFIFPQWCQTFMERCICIYVYALWPLDLRQSHWTLVVLNSLLAYALIFLHFEKSQRNKTVSCQQDVLPGGWTNPFEKYARQIGSFPQIGVKITNLWNHNLEMYLCICTSSEDCTCVSVKNHAQMHQNKAAPKKTSPSHLFPSCTCQHSPIHDNWNKFMKHIPMYITFWKVPAKKNQRLRGWGIHVLLALSARKRIMKWSNWLLLNMYSEFPPGFATDHGQTIP